MKANKTIKKIYYTVNSPLNEAKCNLVREGKKYITLPGLGLPW